MEKMSSSVSSIPFGEREKSLARQKDNANQQFYAGAASKLVIAGTPGDVDQREFLGDSLKPFANIQIGNGNLVTSSIAWKTDTKPYRDVDPGRFDGLSPVQGDRPPIPTPALTYPFDGLSLTPAASNPRKGLLAKLYGAYNQQGVATNLGPTNATTQVLIGKGRY